ncbi:putative monoglyceride lipase [Leishmania mexicana MHOM/GT/2001/U1103]|uniref:Monoglyceride lipase n=1 Tax=Leishmania mexicana (strain MHOM/GT/2001/U1103) TaxID=929439 RepID=E9B1R1_LEIMU|nr:putative monoglyceride lipase [Leishmania mexicana MHOM/GT/2001/U1103]CBZ29168.1 putative monoglyceride lipase [Leishmania mexicana MHOM/GT/2001/U1103]
MPCCCSGGHRLKYATPGRAPPDPQLFPHYMQNAQNLWLHFNEWWPHGDGGSCPTPPIKGVIFIVPGLGEHTGRYDSVALRLNQEGYVVFSMDNQGTGGSEGERLYVERFTHFVDDVCAFILFIQTRYPALKSQPTFLMGHSMGGLIAVLVAERDASGFRGVVLSGPALGLSTPVPRFMRSLAGFLSKWFPKVPVRKLNPKLVSYNTPVVQLVQQDPFYSNAMLRARFVDEMLNAQDRAAEAASTAKFPFLIVHGEKDELCSLEMSKCFFENALSLDKHLASYHRAGHEVLTELCRDEVMADVMKFINERAG